MPLGVRPSAEPRLLSLAGNKLRLIQRRAVRLGLSFATLLWGASNVPLLFGGLVSVPIPLLRYFQSFNSSLLLETPVRKSRRSMRRLRMETLETRYALSSLTTIDSDACLPVEEEQEAVASTVSVSDPAPAESGKEVFVGPLEADAYYQSLAEAESELPAQEGEETDSTTSGDPTIWTFHVTYDGNYWIVAGELTDDKDPSYCTVKLYYDGTLQPIQLDVLPDGSFMHYAIEQPGSVVSAVATDADGNTSNMMATIV